MIHHKCFAVDIFQVPDVLDKDIMQSMLLKINSLFQHRMDTDKQGKTTAHNNWQTEHNLHTIPEFKKLSKFLIKLNTDLIRKKGYNVDSIRISDMWANVLRPGETHPIHTHSNNFLSGVYYLHSDEASSIIFADPVSARDVITPRKHENNTENSGMLVFKSIPNTAYIFPSWLKHYVPVHKGTMNRISISWNIQLVGQVGEHHEFQSAEFK